MIGAHGSGAVYALVSLRARGRRGWLSAVAMIAAVVLLIGLSAATAASNAAADAAVGATVAPGPPARAGCVAVGDLAGAARSGVRASVCSPSGRSLGTRIGSLGAPGGARGGSDAVAVAASGSVEILPGRWPRVSGSRDIAVDFGFPPPPPPADMDGSGGGGSGPMLVAIPIASVTAQAGMPVQARTAYAGRLTWIYSRPTVRPG
jgi:hypothetical protein